MTSPHTKCNSPSIFKDGRLREGIYKIQNLVSETYLDIHKHSQETCCRPARDLEDGRGIWEIKSFGVGYTVRRIEPGKPDQFCTPMNGVNGGTPLYVNAYPVAWRIETVEDGIHHGYEYVRFYWGPTNNTWDLYCGCRDNGTKVHIHDGEKDVLCQTWILIPLNVEGVSTPLPSSGTLGSGPLPPYETGQSSAGTQHNAELTRDDFGTIVTEVTTITTSRRYRVPDA